MVPRGRQRYGHLRILLLATRDPDGPRLGRVQVLRTVIRCLVELGHEVKVVVIGKARVADEKRDVPVKCIRPLNAMEMLGNVISRVILGSASLNECVCASSRTQATLREICANWSPDVVYADMIRMAPIADCLEHPWILDLDDLLSERYTQFSRQKTVGSNEFGYLSRQLPKFLIRILGALARPVFRFESRRLETRELHWAKKANTVALVSFVEALRMEEKSGRPVTSLPMSVRIPESLKRAPDSRRILCLGSLEYAPNIEAMRFLKAEVLPRLKVEKLDLRFHLVGNCPDSLRDELEDDQIVIKGYVDDLEEEFSFASLLFAPIQSGTGVRVKIVDAMARALPVLSTDVGYGPLGVEDHKGGLVANKLDDMIEQLRWSHANPNALAAIGERGRLEHAMNYADDVILQRWQDVMQPFIQPEAIEPMQDTCGGFRE